MNLNFQMEETPPLKAPQKLPLRRYEKIVMAFALMGVGYLLLSKFVLADEFDKTQRQLAGPGASNLGRVFSRGNRAEAMRLEAACVAAFEAKQPFRARFDTYYSDDSVLTQTYPASKGIVGTSQGKIYFIYLTGSDSHITQVFIPGPVVRTSVLENITWIGSNSNTYAPEPYD